MSGQSRTLFDFLALPESFDVDLDALERAYRTVQDRVHPDRFASAPQAQRRVAAQMAARANEALTVLRDPLSRARYLCELHGVEVAAESNTAMDPEFLMQQMRWRETLDEARQAPDVSAVDRLVDELTVERKMVHETVRARLTAPADYGSAAEAVRRWMFMERFADELARARKQIQEAG